MKIKDGQRDVAICKERSSKSRRIHRKIGQLLIDARESKDFIIVARTDARATEGLDAAIDRGLQNKKTGADAIFIEAPKIDSRNEKNWQSQSKLHLLQT